MQIFQITQVYMNCRFEILTVFKDIFMFKNECAPSQLMVDSVHPIVRFVSRYVLQSLSCEHIE